MNRLIENGDDYKSMSVVIDKVDNDKNKRDVSNINKNNNDIISLLENALQNIVTSESEQSIKRNENSKQIRNSIMLLNNKMEKILKAYSILRDKLNKSESENKRLQNVINVMSNEENEKSFNNAVNWLNEYEKEHKNNSHNDMKKNLNNNRHHSLIENEMNRQYHKRYDSHLIKLQNELEKLESSIHSKSYLNDMMDENVTNNLFNYDHNYFYDYPKYEYKYRHHRHRHHHHSANETSIDKEKMRKKKHHKRRKRSKKKKIKSSSPSSKQLTYKPEIVVDNVLNKPPDITPTKVVNEEDIVLQVQLHSVACVPPPVDENEASSSKKRSDSVIYHELITDSYELSLIKRFVILRSLKRYRCEQALKIYRPYILSPPAVNEFEPYISFCFFVGSPKFVLSIVRHDGLNMKQIDELILYKTLDKSFLNLKTQRVLLCALQPGGTETVDCALSDFIASKNANFDNNSKFKQLWHQIESGELNKRGIRKIYFTKGPGLINTTHYNDGCWLVLHPKDIVPCYITSINHNNVF